jgi:4'-phosphopantetheinyl transferase
MKLAPRHWTRLETVRPELAIEDEHHPAIWLAHRGDDSNTPRELPELLSTDERERFDRFRRPEDRERFVLGRGLLRLLAGSYLQIPPESVTFDCSVFGKPHLTSPLGGRPPLRFNISHSGDVVLLAFCIAREVGIDVEQLRPETEWRDIAPQIFTREQQVEWERLSPEARARSFFQAWTRREAALKATGVGLSGGFTTDASAGLQLFELELPSGYEGSVAVLE